MLVMERVKALFRQTWAFGLLLLPHLCLAKLVHYDLVAENKSVNLSGKETVTFPIAINGSIPAPTLEFVEGDDAEIAVTNKLVDQELSIHWHGILLPNEMDGVPYVTTPSIKSGETFVFKFKLRQSGTYWYHSHTHVQEQEGVYGAFIIRPRKQVIKADREVVAVLSDWTDEDGHSVLRNLRKDGDYYLYKKGTIRSWVGAISAGSLGNFLYNEWTRMGGMDYSDVGYDAFLINGKRDVLLSDAKPGEKVRLRIINAAASTYFYVSLGQAPMKVISADGVDVEPIAAKELLMGMAETYDVLFEVPEKKSYELRVTAQDGTGVASGWIGNGDKVKAPEKPFPDLYATMDHSAHHGHGGHAGHTGHDMMNMEHAGHEGHDMHMAHQHQDTTVETLSVDDLRAQASTELPKSAHVQELQLTLGGDMRRYIWHMNGKAIHQDRNIDVKEGDVIRFTFVNETMMHHPMHLHGHFFRVLNAGEEKSPLKHTVDVPPHGTRTIEFYANEPGEWMLHCHNLYHMKTGMARVVKYLSFTPKPEIAHAQHHDEHNHDHLFYYGRLEAATNHGQGKIRLSKTWDEIDTRFEIRKDFSWGIEGDLFYRRWFNQYFNVVVGGTKLEKEYRALGGVSYLLPFLIETTLLVDHKGELRLDIEKRFQWTSWLFTDVDVTLRQRLESEFEATLMYQPSWAWAGGLMVTEKSFGAGIQYQF